MPLPEPRDRIPVVEGEIVEPDFVDALTARLQAMVREGALTSSQVRSLVQVDATPDVDPGRMLAAAVGGGVGSLWKGIGAAAGAGLAAAAYDVVAVAVRRRTRRSW